jgi:hypothetical protein
MSTELIKYPTNRNSDFFYKVRGVIHWTLLSALKVSLCYRVTNCKHPSAICTRRSVNFQCLLSSFLLARHFITDLNILHLLSRSGDRIPLGARFFAHVQTGPEAHPASCTMDTGSFPGVKRPGRGADQPPPSSAEVKKE